MNKMKIMGMIFVCVLIAFIFIKQKTKSEIIETQIMEEPELEPKVVEIVIIEPTKVEEVEEEELPVIEIKVFEDIPLSYDEQTELWDLCKELHINYWFVLAMIESESSFRADAVGDNGKSVGYAQINKCNWDRMQDDYGLDVHTPIDNLKCCAYICKELIDKYETITEVIMAYKCGESRMKELFSEGIVLECVETICDRAIEMENLHDVSNNIKVN